MRGALPSVVLIGLLVMAYGGRVTWACGGGLVVPLLSAESNGPELRLTNTGSSLKKISIAFDRWHWERRAPVCLELPAGQNVTFLLPPDQVGRAVYVFAEGYWLPAWFTTSDGPSR